MTRKFTLQQNCNASSLSSDSQQLLCEGHGYEALSPKATISRRRGDRQKSYSRAERSPASRTSGLPPSTCGRVSRTASISDSRSLQLQLAQSISIQPLQLKHSRTPQSNTHELHDSTRTDSTVTNSSHHPTDGILLSFQHRSRTRDRWFKNS